MAIPPSQTHRHTDRQKDADTETRTDTDTETGTDTDTDTDTERHARMHTNLHLSVVVNADEVFKLELHAVVRSVCAPASHTPHQKLLLLPAVPLLDEDARRVGGYAPERHLYRAVILWGGRCVCVCVCVCES